MANPKLDFFRFKLKHKSREYKTFRDFMLESGKCKKQDSDFNIFNKLYGYFMNELNNDFAKNDSVKKVMTLISNKGKQIINKHWDERPQPDCARNIIAGVVNGGTYGKERILTELGHKDNANNLNANQPILQYYYIFVYLPLDHNEGFVMLHTDSAEESISNFARKYVAQLFTLGDYQKPTMQIFAPKCFQDEFRKGAVLKSMSFQTTFVDYQIEEDNPIKDVMSDYDVKISITPKGEGDKSLRRMGNIRDYLMERVFGVETYKKGLGEFDRCTVNTINKNTKSSKTFEWDMRDAALTPVVYLKDKVALNNDGTVNLVALDIYCKDLFDSQVLKELRPDKYVD